MNQVQSAGLCRLKQLLDKQYSQRTAIPAPGGRSHDSGQSSGTLAWDQRILDPESRVHETGNGEIDPVARLRVIKGQVKFGKSVKRD